MNVHETAMATEVLRPGDDGYDDAARVFFATGRPALVVRPSGSRRGRRGAPLRRTPRPGGVRALRWAQPARARHQHRRDGDRPRAPGRGRGPGRRAPAGARRRWRDVGRGVRDARPARLGADRRRHGRRRGRGTDPGRRHRLDGAPARPGHRQPGRGTRGDRGRPARHRVRRRAPGPVLGATRWRRQLRRGRRLRLRGPAGQHRPLRDDHLPGRQSGRPAQAVAGCDAARARGAVQHPGAAAPDAGCPADGERAALLRRRTRCRGGRRRRGHRAAAGARHRGRGQHRRAQVRRDPGGRRSIPRVSGWSAATRSCRPSTTT